MADPNFRLQKGLFIGSQTGFVDAFNYMYENINGLEGGQGVELDKSIDGAWQINADQSTDSGSGGGGSGNVVFTGTDGSTTDALSEFTFASALSSNVEVTCAENTITIGVYYI